MKTVTKVSVLMVAFFMAAGLLSAQQQIPFQGMVSQGFGVAAWNADGTGPEPAATGHQVPFPGFGNQFYYGASRDYVSGNPDHTCFAFSPDITGFPNFTQALTDHGFTPDQIKAKFGLVTLGEDEEGLDWFVMGNFHHSSHRHSSYNVFELNGEPMLAIKVDYGVWSVQNGTTTYIIDFGYTPLINISGNSSAGVRAVAQAFLEDLDGKSVRLQCESTYGGVTITGNGRNGAYYNIINGILTVGNPTIPIQGLYTDNQGAAAWDADGTGPEPFGNGHHNFLYYAASVDYDGINPNLDACLARLMDGSSGFNNTLIQLQYRGFEMGDLKLKMGLSSLGPDVQGEDWGTINGIDWLNQYNTHITIELDGQPILTVLQDTNRMVFYNPANMKWSAKTSIGKLYNISGSAPQDAQYVASSLLRDIGSHYLITEVSELSYAGSFGGNGRSGAWYEVISGQLKGVYEQATFVSEGAVSGAWSKEGSPYYVDGHLDVVNGETLIIDPGVKVAVRGTYHFDVQGCVKAEGTADKNIVFTRSNPNLYWDGFDYFETSNENELSVFDYCIFEYGHAQGDQDGLNSGGAFAVKYFDNIEIKNSLFRYNFSDIPGYYPPSGGAIGLWNADILIQSCVFHDNYSGFGGAIFSYSHADPIISNCLFYDNHAEFGGALCYWSQASGKLINNTIVDNTAIDGGGLYFYFFSNPEIINNIIWGNSATGYGNQAYFSENNIPGFYYNNIEEGSGGFGGNFIGHYLFNIDEDPAFETSPEFPPYMISGESPCIDAGTPDTSAWHYPQYLPATCLCGNPRIYGSCIDIGAYEQLSVGIRQAGKPGQIALKASPNPFSTSLKISFTTDHPTALSIEIFNATGEKVDQIANTEFSAGDHTLTWQNAALPKGMYFIRLNTNTGSFTQKIVKH
jgi:hypothetical protein